MNDVISQDQYIMKIKQMNEQKTLYYYILTMGCQLNENDSEKISGMMEKMGYTATENLDRANIYVINTCCVRENAEEKLFREIRRTKSFKSKKQFINCGLWLYDARKTYARKN